MKNKLLFVAAFVAFGILLGLRSYWINEGESRTQAKWDAAIAATATAAVEHQQQQIKKRIETESHINQEVERINQNDHNRAQIMEARIDELSSANNGLQLTIEQQNARIRRMSAASANTCACPALDATATRTGDVFAECSTKYATMAADAERLARQVAGLQDYARMCQEYRK